MCPGQGQGSGTLGWLLLGGVSWEGDNALLYPVPACWVSRGGSTELALPRYRCELGALCVSLPRPLPGTNVPLPGAAGVSLCSGGPWIVPRSMLGSVLPWLRHGHSVLPCKPGCGRGYQSPAPLGWLSLGSWYPSLPNPCTLVGRGSAFSGRLAPQPRPPQHPPSVGAGDAAQHHPHVVHLGLCLLISPPTGTHSIGVMKLICFLRVYWCQTCRFTAPVY